MKGIKMGVWEVKKNYNGPIKFTLIQTPTMITAAYLS